MRSSIFIATLALLTCVLRPDAALADVEISNISPNFGPTSGMFQVQITGDGFTGFFGTEEPTVFIGAAALPVLHFNDNQITAIVPPGQGVNLPVFVQVDGESDVLPGGFSYSPPVIQMISPNFGPLDGGQIVTITGQNFGLTPTVTIGGVNHVPTMTSHTQLKIVTQAVENAGPAPLRVTVLNQVSAPATYTYVAEPPIVSLVLPNSAPTAGGTAFMVLGSNFGDDPQANINGNPAMILFSTDDMLLIEAPEGQGAAASLTISNGQAPAVAPPFAYHAPTVTGFSEVSPTNKLTIFGSNFGQTPTVTIGGVAAPLSQSGDHLITVNLPAFPPNSEQAVVVHVVGQSSAPKLFTYPSLPADLNNDGEVNGADLAMLLANWGIVK